MEVGYNYPAPSNKMGNWIGPWNRQDLLPSDYLTTQKKLVFADAIERNLQILKDAGITVIRWFLLGNGFNYGPVPQRKTLSLAMGPVIDIFEFTPPPSLDPLFISHFVQLMEIHRRVGLRAIPSLLSFEFFGTYETSKNGAGGRYQIAEDSQKRDVFLRTVLDPFLSASASYRDLIYAWEVINEPAWTIRTFTPESIMGSGPWVSVDAMKVFIKQSTDLIERRKFPSTVGHRFRSDLEIFDHGTKPQFHYYARTFLGISVEPPRLPLSRDAYHAFLGEIGSTIGKGYEKNILPRRGQYGEPWPGEPVKDPSFSGQVVYERLKTAKQRGYELVMLWPELEDSNVNDVDGLKISPDKLKQVRRFMDEQ